jgi:hypothetical protein
MHTAARAATTHRKAREDTWRTALAAVASTTHRRAAARTEPRTNRRRMPHRIRMALGDPLRATVPTRTRARTRVTSRRTRSAHMRVTATRPFRPVTSSRRRITMHSRRPQVPRSSLRSFKR